MYILIAIKSQYHKSDTYNHSLSPSLPISDNLRVQYFVYNSYVSVYFLIIFLKLNSTFLCIFLDLSVDSLLTESNGGQTSFLATNCRFQIRYPQGEKFRPSVTIACAISATNILPCSQERQESAFFFGK